MRKVFTIETVSNGYIAVDDWDIKSVHKSLRDLADQFEPRASSYLQFDLESFRLAIAAANEGRKIDAIKLVRTMFGSELIMSLRDAKNLVEALVPQKPQYGTGQSLGEILADAISKV